MLKSIFKKTILHSLFLVVLACSHKPVTTQPDVDSRQTPQLGIQVSQNIVRFPKALANGADGGVKIDIVFPYFAAAQAGLRSDDVVVAVDDQIFKNLPNDYHEIFVQKIRESKIGDQLRWIVLRDGKELKTLTITSQARVASFGDVPTNLPENWPGIEKTDPIQDEINPLIEGQKITEEFNDLKSRLASQSTMGDGRRLPIVSYLQKNPTQVANFQNRSLEVSRACLGLDPLTDCWPLFYQLAGLAYDEPDPLIKNKPERFMDVAGFVVRKSDREIKRAFKNFKPEELDFTKRYYRQVVDALRTNQFLAGNEDSATVKRNLRMMELMQKVDFRGLLNSIKAYESLFDIEYLKSVRAFYESKGKAWKEIVDEIKVPQGKILVGGTGPNDYSKYVDQDVVLIIDLGGNDKYPDLAANIIDLSGNDKYESFRAWTLNSGFFRSRILFDLSGKDFYQCVDGCLASSFFGASLFADMSGDDQYTAGAYSMGTAFAGISLMIDMGGNDSYKGEVFTQGVGIAGGLGILLDRDGQDSYLSQTATPSEYKDEGEHKGWAQGVGFGLRNFVSGGWGLLYDGGGEDRFRSGTFSQGGGYYFGVGSLINDGDDGDSYQADRYCQGFSAHYAVGTLLDTGGDDSYETPNQVGEGIAWDLSISLFEDLDGNDQYKACNYCLGSAFHTSMAFFFDHKGEDTYKGSDLPSPLPRSNSYHGGKSFGLFHETGAGRDSYQHMSNNTFKTLEGWQFLIDQ